MRTFILATICAIALYSADPSKAPGFSLPDSKGELHDLADYQDKVVILEFMQTGCPKCTVALQLLDTVKQRFGDNIEILGVVNPPDNDEKVVSYIADHRITHPILFDCGQVAYSYIRATRFDLPQIS